MNFKVTLQSYTTLGVFIPVLEFQFSASKLVEHNSADHSNPLLKNQTSVSAKLQKEFLGILSKCFCPVSECIHCNIFNTKKCIKLLKELHPT